MKCLEAAGRPTLCGDASLARSVQPPRPTLANETDVRVPL
jgi:hypothetical protein